MFFLCLQETLTYDSTVLNTKPAFMWVFGKMEEMCSPSINHHIFFGFGNTIFFLVLQETLTYAERLIEALDRAEHEAERFQKYEEAQKRKNAREKDKSKRKQSRWLEKCVLFQFQLL